MFSSCLAGMAVVVAAWPLSPSWTILISAALLYALLLGFVSFTRAGTIARATTKEAVRQPVFIILLALSVAATPRIRLELPERRHLAHFGVPLLDTELAAQVETDTTGGLQRRCAVAFVHVTRCATAAAATAGNLHRLIAEYRRTDRRARALENVILPEVGRRLHEIEAALEDGDLEETLRTRLAIANGAGLL